MKIYQFKKPKNPDKQFIEVKRYKVGEANYVKNQNMLLFNQEYTRQYKITKIDDKQRCIKVDNNKNESIIET